MAEKGCMGFVLAKNIAIRIGYVNNRLPCLVLDVTIVTSRSLVSSYFFMMIIMLTNYHPFIFFKDDVVMATTVHNAHYLKLTFIDLNF